MEEAHLQVEDVGQRIAEPLAATVARGCGRPAAADGCALQRRSGSTPAPPVRRCVSGSPRLSTAAEPASANMPFSSPSIQPTVCSSSPARRHLTMRD